MESARPVPGPEKLSPLILAGLFTVVNDPGYRWKDFPS